MKLCDSCGAKNLNSAIKCESCDHLISDQTTEPETNQNAEYQEKILSKLESLNSRVSDLASERHKDKPVILRGVDMNIYDAAIVILKWTIASLPTASIIFILSVAVAYVLRT